MIKYQDELEAGKRPRKTDMTYAQQVEHYRRKLLQKEEDKARQKVREREREKRREDERERVKEWERAREKEREREARGQPSLVAYHDSPREYRGRRDRTPDTSEEYELSPYTRVRR